MLKKIMIMISLLLGLSLISPLTSSAKTDLSDKEIAQFLDTALNAQLSLNNEQRSLSEVKEVLSPYFTEAYMEMFIRERLFQENKGWYLPGSDDYYAFVPLFSYDERTVIHHTDRLIKISEFVEANDQGPWSWDAHTESLVLRYTTEGWKISNINDILKNANPIVVVIEGKRVNLVQPPIIENQRTLVPLRGVFEYMYASVSWFEELQKIIIQKDDIFISTQINSKIVQVNENLLTMDIAPKIVNGYTMVPIRFISETLGMNVSWQNETRKIEIKQ